MTTPDPLKNPFSPEFYESALPGNETFTEAGLDYFKAKALADQMPALYRERVSQLVIQAFEESKPLPVTETMRDEVEGHYGNPGLAKLWGWLRPFPPRN
ncbi:hypothetical protein JQ628_11525 [Bradyrhizobium lablabi]|uniref:hypothetical protein n=1 Tax=Bradyrhizobium lablabi TaxID=722472 RepID=UPI001BA8AFC1|nr:hypothetical protein [Bradyrhizobium lablabi]MBR1122146.1 hypothetical protein [Bradyrhizobium lablabi]